MLGLFAAMLQDARLGEKLRYVGPNREVETEYLDSSKYEPTKDVDVMDQAVAKW